MNAEGTGTSHDASAVPAAGLRFARTGLVLAALGGAAALASFLRTPSMERNVWLLGYSAPRILLAGLDLVAVMAVAFVAGKALVSPRWLCSALTSLARWTGRGHRPLVSTLFLVFALQIELVLLLCRRLLLADYRNYMLSVILDHAFPLILWLALGTAEALGLLFLLHRVSYTKVVFGAPESRAAWFLLVALSAAVVQWAVLGFRVPLQEAIPGWFWIQYPEKTLTPRYLLFVPLVGATLGATAAILRHPVRHVRNLLILIALGYSWQVGIGFVDGGGWESIRQRYVDSHFIYLAEAACTGPGILPSIVEYESRYAADYWLSTKAPGLITFYNAVRGIAASEALFGPGSCLLRLTSFAAYVFPLVSLIALVPMLLLAKGLLAKEDAIIPCLLYVVCPNVVTMHLIPDQFLFPLACIIAAWLIHRAVRTGSPGTAFGSGVVLYLCVFMSLSLLPLLGLAVLWPVIDHLISDERSRAKRPAIVLAGMGIGFLLTLAFFRLAFSYDPLVRLNATVRHPSYRGYGASLSALARYVILNNIEFGFWSGSPVFALWIGSTVLSALALLRRTGQRLDAWITAFAAVYVGLPFVGHTPGEVGRLWLFLLPLVCIAAVPGLRGLTAPGVPPRAVVYFLVAGQVVTTLLFYHFLDFGRLTF